METITEPEPSVMFCLDCMFKHLRDLEHHMEDAVRVDKEARRFWEDRIDELRELRKYVLDRMKGKKHEECTACQTGNPIPERCSFRKVQVKPKEHFDKRSFRTLCPESVTGRCEDLPSEKACATRIIIGCPKGKYVKGRCRVGTQTHVIYHGRPK